MNELKDWSKKNSAFLKLGDGESEVAIYKGYKIVPNRFDPDKEQIRYAFEIDGEIKSLDSGSTALADKFAGIKEGTKIEIKRNGVGSGTSYEVTVAGEEKEPNPDGPPQSDESPPF